jgi:hypothetical protein
MILEKERKLLYYAMITMLLLLIVVVSSCSPVECSEDQKKNLGVLVQDGCEPPCWNNIYPGMKVAKSNLLSILHSIPEVGYVITNTDTPDYIGFSWIPGIPDVQNAPKSSHSYIVMDNNKSIIEIIYLNIPYTLTLDTIICNYGSPTSYFYQMVGQYIKMFIYYPEHGFIFTLESMKADQVYFQPKQHIKEVIYCLPSDTRMTSNPMVPWSGYGPVTLSATPIKTH